MNPLSNPAKLLLVTLLRARGGVVQLLVIRLESVGLHPSQQEGTGINGAGVRWSQMEVTTRRSIAAALLLPLNAIAYCDVSA